MAYLTNLLLGETESGYQHQSTDSPRRIGTVPNLLGPKSPSDNLWFPEGQPLLEYPIAAEPIDAQLTPAHSASQVFRVWQWFWPGTASSPIRHPSRVQAEA